MQNVRCVESKKDSFLEHWSQPGLVPRDFSRGDDIRRVGFVGVRRNLAQAFRDGAFEALRRSELDFARGDKLETALESIARLQEDPALYRAMIENGRTRAEAYSDERQAMRWEAFFRGPMQEGYQRWCRDSLPRRALRSGDRVFCVRAIGRSYGR